MTQEEINNCLVPIPEQALLPEVLASYEAMEETIDPAEVKCEFKSLKISEKIDKNDKVIGAYGDFICIFSVK